MAILFSGAKPFKQFRKSVIQVIICEISRKLSIDLGRDVAKRFCIFSSDGIFVQRSGTILAILAEGRPSKDFCEIIMKSCHWPWRRSNLCLFLFLALAAILFIGADQFWLFW